MLIGYGFIWILSAVTVAGFRQTRCEEEEQCCSSPNVRTVIFRQTDMDKACWSREEIALLFTRRMLQELLPKRKPAAVPLLLDYFKECLETVKKLATSRRTHTLVITALADTLGGYLQAFGLPMAHQAFYEGTLGYNGVKQLHELQDAFKKLLRTDGGGWTKPVKIKRSSGISPLHISKAPPGVDPCLNMVTKNELSRDGGKTEILMPFFDDGCPPTSIALPFKDRNLYSLCSKNGVNILVKYYSKSVWCLTQVYGTASIPESGPSQVPQVQCFFTSFSQWIEANVLPRLRDPILYPAFGSVLRLVATLHCRVKEAKTLRGKMFNGAETLGSINLSDECEDEDDATPRKFYIIVISSLVIAFWLIVLIIYLLFKWVSRRNCPDGNYSTAYTSTEECSSVLDSIESDTSSCFHIKLKRKKRSSKPDEKKERTDCDK